jgi:predicted nucleic acid-binding protein
MSLLHTARKDKHDASLHEKYNMKRNTFVFDSGATSHMRFSKDGMINLKPLKIAIKVGNAEDIYSEAIGTFEGLVTHKDGSTFPSTLEDVLYIPDLYVNLFSMTRVLKNKTVDFKGEKGTIAVVYDKDHKLLFDKIIKVGHGKLLGVDIVPYQENLHIHIRSFKELHEKLGHPNDAVLKATAKKFNLQYDRTVLVLRSRLRTFQRKLQHFLQKR